MILNLSITVIVGLVFFTSSLLGCGSSGFLVGNLYINTWGEIEFTAEKEDASAVVFKRTKSPCGDLDRLNTRVESFGNGVGDTVVEVVKQTGEMVL